MLESARAFGLLQQLCFYRECALYIHSIHDVFNDDIAHVTYFFGVAVGVLLAVCGHQLLGVLFLRYRD